MRSQPRPQGLAPPPGPHSRPGAGVRLQVLLVWSQKSSALEVRRRGLGLGGFRVGPTRARPAPGMSPGLRGAPAGSQVQEKTSCSQSLAQGCAATVPRGRPLPRGVLGGSVQAEERVQEGETGAGGGGVQEGAGVLAVGAGLGGRWVAAGCPEAAAGWAPHGS